MKQPILLNGVVPIESVNFCTAFFDHRNILEKTTNTIDNSAVASTLFSEYRLDPATGLWTLIAEGRDARPSNTEKLVAPSNVSVSKLEYDSDCPFCRGNEERTPVAVAFAAPRLDSDGTGAREVDEFEIVESSSFAEVPKRAWFSRAFENKYPFFRENFERKEISTFESVDKSFSIAKSSTRLFFNSISGCGRHEVIVDSPRHLRSWSEFTDLEIKLAFRLFRSRLKASRDDGRFAYSFVFKNVGSSAGASQRHTHCQLTGNVEIPPDVKREMERLTRYERLRKTRGEEYSFWDALLEAELRAQSRVVAASDRFVVYCPYASRFPVQTEICPRFDGAFEDYDDSVLDELALLARRTVAALEKGKRRRYPDDPRPLDYNVVLKNVPTGLDSCRCEELCFARPRWLIFPSLVKKAGFEIGCGIDVNPISPETAARLLRATF